MVSKRKIVLKKEFEVLHGPVAPGIREQITLEGILFRTDGNYQITNLLSVRDTDKHIQLYCYDSNMPNLGDSGEKQFYAVLQIDLEKELPYILLDSIANNTVHDNLSLNTIINQLKNNVSTYQASIPKVINKKHLIQLEGDFNDYFKLYSAEKDPYKTLALITPDVMQALKDSSGLVDMEIFGRKLTLFTQASDNVYSNYNMLLETEKTISRSLSRNIKNYKSEQLIKRSGQNVFFDPQKRANRLAAIAIILGLLIPVILIILFG